MKVLLADDDAVARVLLRQTLERTGYEVVSAEDGETALDMLLLMDDPCIALVDWTMPGLDGLSVCREVRSSVNNHSLYLILLTAKRSIADIVEGLDAGADAYLTKPYDAKELQARILVGQRTLHIHNALRQGVQHDQPRLLPTRNYLTDRLSVCVAEARQNSDYKSQYNSSILTEPKLFMTACDTGPVMN